MIEVLPQLEVSFEIARAEDISEISILMESVFGSNPKSIETFNRWINEKNYHVTVAKVDSKIVGVASSWVCVEPNLTKYEPYGAKAVDFLRGQKLGWFLTLAVQPLYRKSKIGWKLSQDQMNWLKSQECTSLVGASWVTGSTDNSSHMFIKSGFEKLGESNVVLRIDLQVTGATCGACKKNECECSAILYGLRM